MRIEIHQEKSQITAHGLKSNSAQGNSTEGSSKGSGLQGGQARSREEGGLQKTQASLEAGKASARENRQVKPRTARAQESGCFRHGQNRRVTGLAGPDSTLTSTGGGKCGCRAALGWAGTEGYQDTSDWQEVQASHHHLTGIAFCS